MKRKSRTLIKLEYDRVCGAVNALTDIEEMVKKFSNTITGYCNELELQRSKLRKELMKDKINDRN